MKYFYSLLRVIFSIYGFLVFLLLMFTVFPVAVFVSFFGKIEGGNMIYKVCFFWTNCAIRLWGIFHRNIFEAPHDKTKEYIFLFNHISYLDGPFLLEAIRGQHFRVLGKSELGKIPIFGFFYRRAAVMVDRSDPKARAKSVAQLKAFIRKGISVVIAPEGTFNETNQPLCPFFKGAFRIAIETQTPIKPILLLDAYDRLHYRNILTLTPGRSRAVFLEEIPVVGLTMDDVDMLKDKVFKIMEQKLIDYKASWIKTPPSPKGV